MYIFFIFNSVEFQTFLWSIYWFVLHFKNQSVKYVYIFKYEQNFDPTLVCMSIESTEI